ncbi:hypothetical protein K439DRAFT_1247453, partial [Ramaria rubella]
AIQACKLAMAGTGQLAWNHTCNLCTKHVNDAPGQIVGAYQSVVTDGVSLGHPCCAIHNCKESLPTNKHHYCTTHANLSEQCAVSMCHANIKPSFWMCSIPTHHAAEECYSEQEHGSAMFQLKHQNAKTHNLLESEWDDEEEVEEEEEQAMAPCSDKPALGHRRVAHTLCVASCGIILGRVTFYGAEGPNIWVPQLLWKDLFPTKASNPAIHWFDNNCHVTVMCEASNDMYFNHVALPVDVFHFKSKHKGTDEYCGCNYNLAQWAELMDDSTGKWIFNSSAAEQVNLWLGGFCAMTQLM